MRIESSVSVILRILGKILLADLILFIFVGAVCWIFGWRTMNTFATALMYAGMGAVVLGGMSALGGNSVARDPTYRYIQSVMPNSMPERTKQDWLENIDSINFLTYSGVAGIIATAAGYLLYVFIK
jgi:hypothetical protein